MKNSAHSVHDALKEDSSVDADADSDFEPKMAPEEIEEKINELNDRISSAMNEMKTEWNEDPEGFIEGISVADDDIEGDIQELGFEAQLDGYDTEAIFNAINDEDYLIIADVLSGDAVFGSSEKDADAAKEEACGIIEDAFESYYESGDDVDNDNGSDGNSFMGRLEDAKDAIMDGISSLINSIFGGLEKDMEKDSDKAAGDERCKADNESGRDGADAENKNKNVEAENTDTTDGHTAKEELDDYIDKFTESGMDFEGNDFEKDNDSGFSG